MPFAVYVLGAAIFAQGTSELMLAGLLPGLAADLGVSVPRAGLLISAFALGMLAGAPILAVLTLRVPRRTALLAFLGVFVAAHIVGALTGDYAVLFATRVVAAFVYAGFWAVAATTAVSLVPADARGRAMSVVAGGLTLATVLGLPLGTVLAQHWGWRATFLAVAALTAAIVPAVLRWVPGARPGPAPRLRGELGAMANPRLWLSYGSTALATTAALVVFAYLGALLAESTGLGAGWVPVLLALHGIGAMAGITLGGRFADAHPFRTLYAGFAGVAVTGVLLALLAAHPIAVAVLVTCFGAACFATNPALNTRVFTLAGGAPTLATAVNVSAFNVGITAGPWLGGLLLTAGYGYPATGWLAAAVALLALGSVAVGAALHRRAEAAAARRLPVSESGRT